MTAAATTEEGDEQIHNISRFFIHPRAYDLGFRQSHLRSHLILETTHLGDEKGTFKQQMAKDVCTHSTIEFSRRHDRDIQPQKGNTLRLNEGVSSVWMLLSISLRRFKACNFKRYEMLPPKLFCLKDDALRERVPSGILYICYLTHTTTHTHVQTHAYARMHTPLCMEHLLNYTLHPST